MLTIYTSGANHLNSQQKDISKSLGGFISSTPLPNGNINAIFSDVSSYGIENKIEETIAVFIKNESADAITDVVIKQIYNNTLGKDDNLCKFEWAVVLPSEQGFIEKIGNRREFPYNAVFFEPKVRREDLTLKITAAGQIGEELVILGETITLESNTVDGNVFDIVEHFDGNTDFLVQPVGSDSVYIKRMELVGTGNALTVGTSGTFQFVPVNFSGFVDNGFEISESLGSGEFLGLWIKRTINKQPKTKWEDLEKEYDELFGTDFSEEVVEDHNDNIEALEVVFSWV